MPEVVQLLGGWLDAVLGGQGGVEGTQGHGDEQVELYSVVTGLLNFTTSQVIWLFGHKLVNNV